MTDPYNRTRIPEAYRAPRYFSLTRPFRSFLLFVLWLAYYAVPSETYWNKAKATSPVEIPEIPTIIGYFLIAIMTAILTVATKLLVIPPIVVGFFVLLLFIRSIFCLSDYDARMHWREKIMG